MDVSLPLFLSFSLPLTLKISIFFKKVLDMDLVKIVSYLGKRVGQN